MDQLQLEWAKWHPGPTLRILRTEYASVIRPIVEFVEHLRATRDEQIVVLIPVVMPSRLRYRFLHNHLDLVLSGALRRHPGVVVARVGMALDDFGEGRGKARAKKTGALTNNVQDTPGRQPR